MTLKPVSFKKGRAHEPRLSEPYVPGKRHPRYWTEEEIAILREYYPVGGVDACHVHLPNRRVQQIYSKASLLGIKCDRHTERQRWELTEDRKAQIMDEWPVLAGKKGGVAALADRMGVPRHWLSQQALKLGLAMPHKKEPPWTAAEDDLLRTVPLHNPRRCSEIFRDHGYHRTPASIMVRTKRQSLSRRATHEGLSATKAAAILGVDNKYITSACISGSLVASRRGTKRLPQQGGDVWEIKPADLRQFVIDNIERIDIRKVDKLDFVDLLTNPAHLPAES